MTTIYKAKHWGYLGNEILVDMALISMKPLFLKL